MTFTEVFEIITNMEGGKSEGFQFSINQRYFKARQPAVKLLKLSEELKDRFPVPPLNFSLLEPLGIKNFIAEPNPEPTEQEILKASEASIMLVVDTASQLAQDPFKRAEITKDKSLLGRLLSILQTGQEFLREENFRDSKFVDAAIKKTLAMRKNIKDLSRVDTSHDLRRVRWAIDRLREASEEELKRDVVRQADTVAKEAGF